MVNSWQKALKLWNAGNRSWCIPKKGTPEYEEVRNIQNIVKAQEAAGGERVRRAGENLEQPVAARRRLDEDDEKFDNFANNRI
jgi:hypothetical protein